MLMFLTMGLLFGRTGNVTAAEETARTEAGEAAETGAESSGEEDSEALTDETAEEAGETDATEAEAVLDASETESAEEAEEENYDTGDAALDDARNQDEIGEKELLVVSFGTSFNDSRRLTIGAIEGALADAFPDYSVRRGFTSQIIIDHVKSRDGVVIDNITEALDRAVANGVKTLVVQPTHLMNGFEYNDLVTEIAQYADAFERIAIGEPLLTSDEDFEAVARAVMAATAEYDDGETAIVFMGHGTEAESNGVYAKMQTVFAGLDAKNYFIGTVEATPSLDDVLEMVQAGEYKRVVLEPLMVVAGDHANNDMAGDEEDSWKSVFEAAGYEVVPVLRGLGELEEIRRIYTEHAQAAIDNISVTDQVADASEMTEVEEVAETGMEPVSVSELVEGTYELEMNSSSSMFKADHVQLKVSEDSMEAVLYMTSRSYLYMFAGTAAEAAAADEADYIRLEETPDGMGTFTLPVKALDEGESFAAYSRKKEKWYDRTLLFKADSLPVEAYRTVPYTTVSSLGLADGEYTAEVTLEGGSGRASVDSPVILRVEGDTATAVITWSSPNYDYMMIDDVRYDPVNTEGNSTFEIPVKGFDFRIPVQADTTAMSQPYLIDYTLCFDAAGIAPVQ